MVADLKVGHYIPGLPRAARFRLFVKQLFDKMPE
jgi:hypothetical protein